MSLTIPQKLLSKMSIRHLSDLKETVSSAPPSPTFSAVDSPSAEQESSSVYASKNRLESVAKEQAFQNDPRFRKYVQLIEKNLQSFDAVNEWADVISFLGRLLKSFQAYPQFPIVPRKHTVAKRLAQCLNPGFPAGVHQKTLDVYAYLLETIGPDQMAEDLTLWSMGLFPFVQYAATHVKPQLLAIFEKHYFPLRGRLRPAMRGFIIALLPALEEEGSESFDKVVSMIDYLSSTTDMPFFYSCIWLVMISNSSLRLPALNYLLRRLPKIINDEDVCIVLGDAENVRLMTRAFSATLNDQQLLVQRSMLELLVQNISLKNRTIPHEDLVLLIRSALAIVLRKDMSLNRRLYAWVLGPETSSQTQLGYFYAFTEKAATQAIRGLLSTSHDNQLIQSGFVADTQKPYKILISLMDKWEIGQPIVDIVFIDALLSLQGHGQRGIHSTEILQTANMWLEMVEPYLIWMKLFKIIDTSFPDAPFALGNTTPGTNIPSDLESMRLMRFTLKAFKFSDEEVWQMHLPLIIAALTRKLQESISHPSFIDMLPQVKECIGLVQLLLEQLPESVFRDQSIDYSNPNIEKENDQEQKNFVAGMNILDYARDFYGLRRRRHTRNSSSIGGNSLSFRFEEIVTEAGQSSDREEEEGDMSVSSSFSPNSIASLITRPAFGSIRGSVLIHELTNNLSQLLIDLVNGYIVLPENLSTGVDVGKDGRSLTHINSHLERVLIGICSILTFVVKRTNGQFKWMNNSIQQETGYALLKCCRESQGFGSVDAGLSTLCLFIKRSYLTGDTLMKSKQLLKSIMDKLWGFLVPSLHYLHRRTVDLIWLLTETSSPHHIETIITHYLVTSNDEERLVNFEKFGCFWEFSENFSEAGLFFSRPVMLVLDLLKEGTSPIDKRAGETWIRCHSKSYLRLLEPFLIRLLDNFILFRPAEKIVPYQYQTLRDGQDHGATVEYFIYMRPFDMDAIDYMISTLNVLIGYSGTSVLKAFRQQSVDITGSISDHIKSFLGISLKESEPMSFLELLVRIVLRYLESEPSEASSQTMLKSARSIQLNAAKLIHLILSKCDTVEMHITRLIQESVIKKVLFCIHTGNLEIQQKLMHILHSSMAITAVNAMGIKPTSASDWTHRKRRSIDHASTDMTAQYATGILPRIPNIGHTMTHTHSEALSLVHLTSFLYVKCVIDALVMESNRPLLQQWMDFILATLPHLCGGFRHIIIPVLMCMCEQLRVCQKAVESMVHSQLGQEREGSNEKHDPLCENSSVIGCPETDLIVFLVGLEKVLMFCLTERTLCDDWYPTERTDLTMLLTPKLVEQSTLRLFSHIVYNEEVNRSGEKPHDIILYYLPVFLHLLLDIWRTYRKIDGIEEDSLRFIFTSADAQLQTFALITQNAKRRLEQIFQKLYKHCPVEFIEGFTEVFFMENPIALEYEALADQIDLMAVEILAATPTISPQHIFSTLLDGIRQRTPGMQNNRRKTILRLGKLTDTSLMRFAEIYCGSIITAEPLAHLWPLIHAFAKDYLSQASAYKTFLPGLLRFLTIVLDILTRYQGFDDKKTRKDAQDLYQRCVDYCILIAGRSFDQSLWLRRSNVHDDNDGFSSISDAMSLSDTIASDLSRNVSTSNVSELEKKASWKAREDMMIIQVNAYLATSVIPNLRLLIGDQDRINSLLNNLVYYVIGPAMRTKTGFNKMAVVLDQICEMARMPFTYRSWRKEVWEVFIDNRFFCMSTSTSKKWRTIIQTVFSLEKERFSELMGRITTTPSTAFFTNKDQETLNRGLNLRRISYVIFCGSSDQYVPQLPLLQEKIVELLKLEHAEMIHVEIYLFLRVMLIRFSQKHLLNFWPVLITELMRLFDTFLYNTNSDRPDEAQIGFAGCKFLDLLCALETDAFQIYQWIFIRDTVEAVLKTSLHGPVPIMERLCEKLVEGSPCTDNASDTLEEFTSSVPSLGELKRPMLTMHSVTSIRQLGFFIEHIGLYVYQSSFTLAKPDMPFIESLLHNDLLGDIDSD
ncbi:Dopey, N-terminal-domain-containing protein [Spinellus fusiger]|nr:Dopey, N-terminal-domain-containing protein [Spinellus fusiger]